MALGLQGSILSEGNVTVTRMPLSGRAARGGGEKGGRGRRRGVVTCVLGADVRLYLRLLHGDEVAGRAADGEHPLLLVHVERHVADKLDVELRLKSTHVTAVPEERRVSF